MRTANKSLTRTGRQWTNERKSHSCWYSMCKKLRLWTTTHFWGICFENRDCKKRCGNKKDIIKNEVVWVNRHEMTRKKDGEKRNGNRFQLPKQFSCPYIIATCFCWFYRFVVPALCIHWTAGPDTLEDCDGWEMSSRWIQRHAEWWTQAVYIISIERMKRWRAANVVDRSRTIRDSWV